MTDQLSGYDGLGLADLIRSGQISAAELVEVVIERIERLNPTLNFMTYKGYDQARAMAADPPRDGAFAGLPWLLKDLILGHAGVPQTSGSRFFRDHVPAQDSLMIQRLKTLGLIYLGSTNVPEFGINLQSGNALFGDTRNPWDPSRTPGGSSGGAAAAVAARIMPLAHGGDGGGSIRVPSSYCGLVGLKPSRGRNSYYPDYADVWYGCGTDGCLSITVRDTAAYSDAMWGSTPGDPYEIPALARPLLQEVGADPGRLRIGVMTRSPGRAAASDDAVRTAEAAAGLCERLGHHVEPVEIPIDYDRFCTTFIRVINVLTAYGLDTAEGLLGRKAEADELQPVVWAIRGLAKNVSGIDHARDVETLRQIGRDICVAVSRYDVVITPSTPVTAPAIGDPSQAWDDVDAYFERLFGHMVFSAPISVSGLPAISLPIEAAANGMPLGTQFIANRGREDTLIRLAAQLEAERPWRDRLPAIVA
ncbi:amidase [Sphingomonas colocasiae]|uniref:Amidase n=1 Tax=Sphingomonas colocasiae TaxID=1848973 RepID=A0ABS7PXI0_9SPHN|nr:amidase [Sphingomonas colocasiae]MBY8825345.1 amidase [Sphingomonas colocasiae]